MSHPNILTSRPSALELFHDIQLWLLHFSPSSSLLLAPFLSLWVQILLTSNSPSVPHPSAHLPYYPNQPGSPICKPWLLNDARKKSHNLGWKSPLIYCLPLCSAKLLILWVMLSSTPTIATENPYCSPPPPLFTLAPFTQQMILTSAIRKAPSIST